MNILPCGVTIKTFKISTRKRVNITYTAISPDCLFGLRYQDQVLKLMRLWKVWVLLPYWFNWVNEPLNTALKTPLPKTKWFFMVSTLWYQLFSTLLYWGRRTMPKQENIIVDTVSTNMCPLCRPCFKNLLYTIKMKNIFVRMVTPFKNNPQWAVPWAIYFLLVDGTISPKFSNVPMLFLKI